MTVEPEVDAQKISDFFLELTTNSELLSRWIKNKALALDDRNIQGKTRELLLDDDLKGIKDGLGTLGIDAASRWIVIWVVHKP